MVNSEQVAEEIKALGLQPGANIIPVPVPVVETNPKMLRRCEIVKTASAANATSATIYTTPADKDFYLSAVGLSCIKDATSTSTLSSIVTTVLGSSVVVIGIAGFTLTAQNDTMTLNFPVPIKVDRNVVISVNNSTNVANVTSRGSIAGYIVEPNQ